MEALLNTAQQLNKDLQLAVKEARDAKAEANTLSAAARTQKDSLDLLSRDLIQREQAVSAIEDSIALLNNAKQAISEAELEWNKIRAEWDKVKTRKQSDQAECQANMNKIEEQRELYERGAKENAIARKKLDERIKKMQELKG